MSHIKSRALELIRTIKTGEPVLNLDRSIAAESLWPTALEQEADKASSILRSFFLDGFIIPYRTSGRCPEHVRLQSAMIHLTHCLHGRYSKTVVDLLSFTSCELACTHLPPVEAV